MRLLAVVVMVHWIEKSSKSKKTSGARSCFYPFKASLYWYSDWDRSSSFSRKIIPWDARYKTHNAELLAWHRLSRFRGPLPKATSRNQNPPSLAFCYAPNPSPGPPAYQEPFLLDAFPESIIFIPRVTELLLLCLVTTSNWIVARARQMQLQMPCLVIIWERPLRPHVSEPRPHVFEPHVSEPRSHVYEPYSFELHSFGPHLVGSLHFFDPDPTAPDSCLRNIRPVLATSVVRRISKRASRRTYKDNVNGMKLGCRAIERRLSEPDNQDQVFRAR